MGSSSIRELWVGVANPVPCLCTKWIGGWWGHIVSHACPQLTSW